MTYLTPISSGPAPLSRFTLAGDGLNLHWLEWPNAAPATPVVCLPGLSRTANDFEALAARLSSERRVLALDYRGRGLSSHDNDWTHYNLMVESADILAVLDAAGISEAIFVGTSRGGLHTMILAVTQPQRLRAAVLNDIGPVLDLRGMARIRSYIGKLPPPGSWADAVDVAKTTLGPHFNGLGPLDFETWAHQTFAETAGVFSARYDPALMKTLESLDLTAPLPDMWPQFEALKEVPVLVLRGENSDLLSPETLTEMSRRHPRLDSFIVPGQGHAPLLLDTPSIERITRFINAN